MMSGPTQRVDLEYRGALLGAEDLVAGDPEVRVWTILFERLDSLSALVVAISKGLKLLAESQDRLEANQERLEKALKAHGVGAWAGLA